jgi:hypothetical protein
MNACPFSATADASVPAARTRSAATTHSASPLRLTSVAMARSALQRHSPGAPSSLHIERLVIDGLALTPAQSAQLHHTLKGELAQLLSENRTAPQGFASAMWRAPNIAAPTQPSPTALGRAIARSLFALLRTSR